MWKNYDYINENTLASFSYYTRIEKLIFFLIYRCNGEYFQPSDILFLHMQTKSTIQFHN